MTVEVQWAAAARAADARQAVYLREALVDERQGVAAGLREARVRLHARVEDEKVVGLRGMARARSKVRELEEQLRELDRMITALDRRFSAAR